MPFSLLLQTLTFLQSMISVKYSNCILACIPEPIIPIQLTFLGEKKSAQIAPATAVRTLVK